MTLHVHKAAIRNITHGANGAGAHHLFRIGKQVEAAAKRRAPVDTGRLRASIGTRTVTGARLRCVIGTNVKHAGWVTKGTGIYGRYKTPVVPRRAKMLRFTSRGGIVIFRRSVKGMKARPFLAEALHEVVGR